MGFVCCTMLSCKTTSLPSQYRPPSVTPAEIAFQNAINDGNIIELLQCAKNYPETKEIVANQILWDSDLSALKYNDIVRCIQMSDGDSMLLYPFLFCQETLEEKIMDEMSELDIDGIKQYYDTHSDDSIFVKRIILNVISELVDSSDYYSLKLIRPIFQNTVFDSNISKGVSHLRDSILQEMMIGLDDYESSIKDVAKSVMAQVYQELDSLTQSSIMNVLQNCMEKELPRRDKKVEERVQMLYKTYVNSAKARKIVVDNVSTFVTSLDESICDLYQSMVTDADCEGGFSSGVVTPTHAGYKILTKEFLAFSDVQRSINWVSIGLNVASVVASIYTGGTAAIIFDGLDLLYDPYHEIKKAKNVNEALGSLGKSMYYNMNKSNEASIFSTLEQLDEYITDAFTNLKNKVYEEF